MMKTLTSSCSKAIIDKNRDRGLSCFKDLSLSRAEVCLLPSKKLVRIRFLHLLSVQHRRLQPVFLSSSLSPDSQACTLYLFLFILIISSSFSGVFFFFPLLILIGFGFWKLEFLSFFVEDWLVA